MDKDLLLAAREDILSLRRVNDILRAKVDTMELFATVLRTTVFRQAEGFGEDIAWRLLKAVEEMDEAKAKKAPG